MTDIIDTANDTAANFIADALFEAARNATSGPAASGQCLNPRCGEDLTPGRRWCDADCRDAWQRVQRGRV